MKMQHQYWVTKKCVLRKLGTKEDECVIASDAELDAKLELFRSVSESCIHLQRVIDLYQERLCILAQEENALGRYLKECGKNERNPEVGRSMAAAGKAIAYVGHQRLALRPSLVRLHHEVETFRGRAITDSRATVSAMEKSRTEYRAALGWMKSASAQLDPDTGHGLDGFRKAQAQVRSSKAIFDRLTLACLQKVDLLAAARCNMFSHALVLYENAVDSYALKANQALIIALKKISSKEEIQESDSQDDKLFFNSEYRDVSDRENSDKIEESSEQLALENHAVPIDSMIQEELYGIPNSQDLLLADFQDNSVSKSADYLPSQLLLKQNNTSSYLKQNSGNTSERTTWFDLFAELDPLANPDMVSGSKNSHSSA